MSSGRVEYEIGDAIELLLQSGRTIDAIRMNSWRVDIGYPEDRDHAENRLQGESLYGDIEETPDTESVVDGNTSTE
jgi:dTDP-glucose pyrophosphorylase